MPSTEHIGTVWGRAFNVMVERGEGVYLIDTEGRRYLDFTSGIGVTSTGHAHPKVAQAIADQATKLIHGQANIVYHQPMMELIDELRSVVAWPESKRILLQQQRRGDRRSGGEAGQACDEAAEHHRIQQFVPWPHAPDDGDDDQQDDLSDRVSAAAVGHLRDAVSICVSVEDERSGNHRLLSSRIEALTQESKRARRDSLHRDGASAGRRWLRGPAG